MDWRYGSRNGAPALQAQIHEFKPQSYHKKKKKRENLVEEQETFQQTMVFFVVSYYRSIWEIKEQHLLIRRFGEICSFNKYLLNTCKGPVLSGWVVSAQR
jgi:hypothetical protein